MMLVGEWKDLGRAYVRGDREGHARWLPGCPAHVSCGGVGGNRLILLTPEPASWDRWLEASANLRNVNLASLAEVDKLGEPSAPLPPRAKQKSPGGTMAVYAPKDSAQRRVNPTWPPRSVRKHEAGPCVDGLIFSEV